MPVGRKEAMILENEKAMEIKKPMSISVVELKNNLTALEAILMLYLNIMFLNKNTLLRKNFF